MMLVVVDRSRPHVYRAMKAQFAGNHDVVVMLDRRASDRRESSAEARQPDRRVRDRRRTQPSFNGRDYFVVITTDHSRPRAREIDTALCTKCGSHRTRVVGPQGAVATVFYRCEACEYVFGLPPRG